MKLTTMRKVELYRELLSLMENQYFDPMVRIAQIIQDFDYQSPPPKRDDFPNDPDGYREYSRAYKSYQVNMKEPVPTHKLDLGSAMYLLTMNGMELDYHISNHVVTIHGHSKTFEGHYPARTALYLAIKAVVDKLSATL